MYSNTEEDYSGLKSRLQFGDRLPELATFNLAIGSKLRSCDLVQLRVRDVCNGDRVQLAQWSCSKKRAIGSRFGSHLDPLCRAQVGRLH